MESVTLSRLHPALLAAQPPPPPARWWYSCILRAMASCERCSSSTAAVQDTAEHSSLARPTYSQAQAGNAVKSAVPSGSSTTFSSRVSQSWDA